MRLLRNDSTQNSSGDYFPQMAQIKRRKEPINGSAKKISGKKQQTVSGKSIFQQLLNTCSKLTYIPDIENEQEDHIILFSEQNVL